MTHELTTPAWDVDGTTLIESQGSSIEEAITDVLNHVLSVARGQAATNAETTTDETIAAPIRGQGTDYAIMLDELIGDVLNQLDVNGAGLHRVRLDGILQRDDGGYTAWGYVLGVPDGATPTVSIAVAEQATISQAGDTTTIRLKIRRV